MAAGAPGQPATTAAGSPSVPAVSPTADAGGKLITIVPGTATVPTEVPAADLGAGDSRPGFGLYAFGAVVLLLVAGVAAGSAWRYRRDRQG